MSRLTSMGSEGKELEQIKNVGAVWQDLEGILLRQVYASTIDACFG